MNSYENISNTLSIDCTVGNNQFLTSPSSPSPISTSTSTTNASSFVKKLFDMVENESDDIIVWVANGTAFEVKDPKRLENEILPNFFRHCRFQSLVRQLNFYAFKKISKERSSWVYSHDHFKKNRPDLLEKLRRKTNGVAAMNKRNAEVLNGMTNTLRKKRKITNENASYPMMNTGMNSSYKGGELSGDESSDEFADDDVLLLDNDESILSNNSPTNVKRNVWSLEKHGKRDR